MCVSLQFGQIDFCFDSYLEAGRSIRLFWRFHSKTICHSKDIRLDVKWGNFFSSMFESNYLKSWCANLKSLFWFFMRDSEARKLSRKTRIKGHIMTILKWISILNRFFVIDISENINYKILKRRYWVVFSTGIRCIKSLIFTLKNQLIQP